MALTILKALIPLAEIDTFLDETTINQIYGVSYIEGGSVLILYS